MHWIRNFLRILSFTLCYCLSFLVAAHATSGGDTPRYAVTGELQSIEEGRIAQIDGKRYLLDQSVLVVDSNDRPTLLQQLKMPVHILFEYSHQQQSDKIIAPVIVYIKETKEARRAQGTVQ